MELVVVFKKEVFEDQALKVLNGVGLPFRSGMDSSKGKTYFYNTGPTFIITIPSEENIKTLISKFQSQSEVYEIYQPDWTIQKD